MAGDSDRSRSLKEALYESLTAVLSPAQEARLAGEEQVKALEVTEEFGVHLAEFTVDPAGSLAIRQLASVLLKQYVETHWSQHSEKFRQPETSEAAKSAIRQILPLGLKESISKVRSSVAYAVSAIAHWDWPEAWPELFHILMEALTSGNQDAVHGAMRVLTEFCREVTDTQMPRVAPVILPEMYKIFTQDEVYSIRTRGRAVDIFNTCAGLISTMNDLHKGVAKQLLFPVLPQFTEAFVQALQVPDGLTSDSGLKMEVLNAITTLVKSFPAQMNQWMPQILAPVWHTLTTSADVYVKTLVNDTEEADDPVDSDGKWKFGLFKSKGGEVLGFESLVFSVFDFIMALIECRKFRGTVKKSMDQLLYYVVMYMQITEEQVKTWSMNPDQYVEEEDDDTFHYSVRVSAQDLLLALAHEFPKESAPAVCTVATRHLQDAETVRAAQNQYWWKVHEAAMFAIGSVCSLIIEHVQENKLQFDMQHFLQSVVLDDLNQNVSPFLLGRCLWIASRYTQLMKPELLQKCLEATVSGLHPNQPASVRISAVRAVFGFCEHLQSNNSTHALQPYLQNMMEGLLAIAQQFSSEVLALCLETLCVVLAVDKDFTASYESKVTPLAIAVFLKYTADPLVVSLTEDVFKVLSENPACIEPLQQRLVPTLVSILHASVDKIPMGSQAVALDIVQKLVRSSQTPLSDLLMNSAFPAAVQCTLKTDDNSTMQSGGECLRAFVSVSLDQVAAWQVGQGHNGIYYVVQVISKLLDPKTSEFTATFVGRLVSILISKLGSQLGENLDLMLRAVLSKMQQAKSLSVIQSLVLVFAHLMHTQMEAVLEFLYNVPGPTGKPALEFVLTEWCSKQHLFYGSYEGKVSSVALSKLLSHVIQTNDKRLQDITVKGEQVFNPNDGIKTRSKASRDPDQWTMIPILVKIYKLLINELSVQIESSMSTQAAIGEEDDEEDIDDEDWDETEESEMNGQQTLSGLLEQFAPASDYSGKLSNLASVIKTAYQRAVYSRYYWCDLIDDEDVEDDPDALNDPIYQIDLQAYLTEFLQSLSRHHCYSMFSQHHNDNERQVLRTIGIQA
ncbi:hypothetical protein LSH36_77g04009 [Paralvinella palmiformis]|uniref:Importin N-terminal domain-containing protein n=1 Tax=Paralvinella palmiformis TaxID=53620 RepID=A0AAD9K2I4_9ANNE|nr:hypothetical protein LSH36_77g04009 [Paralvinella palmiformis]